MRTRRLKGRAVYAGAARGVVLKSNVPLGLFGHLNPATGVYKEAGHPLDGRCVAGRVLAFPRAKGSTVGSYILYALRKTGKAPAALVLSQCDTIVAVGSILGAIPTLDRIDLSRLPDGAIVRVQGGEVRVEAR